MRFLLFSALLAALGACSVDATSDDGASIGGTGGADPGAPLPKSLTFSPAQAKLGAREEIELLVQATPARVYPLRFSLPQAPGSDPKDALLDRAAVNTDKSGRASVTLVAPSEMSTFQVRASVGGSVVATLTVTMTSSVTATVQVKPVRIGRRDPTSWVATVHEDKTCANVKGDPPEDGENPAFASADQAVLLRDVPIGKPLAITLRSGHFMGGCASVESLPVEAADVPRTVEVTVLERPIDLSEAALALTLGLSDIDAWTTLAATTTEQVLGALRGNGVSDADALLDGMREALTGQAQQDLETARSAEGWDDLVQARWGSADKLRDVVSSWLEKGAVALRAGETVLTGQLEPAGAEDAHLTLERVAGLAASDAGFINPASVAWSAGADDTVVVATDLYFVASQLLTSLAEPEALVEYDGVTSAAEALATGLECTALSTDLAAAGSDAQLAFAGCDAACLKQLCETALAALWKRGRFASATSPARLAIAGAGGGRVGEWAELVGISGSWVGQLTTSAGVLPTGGALIAVEPPREQR